MTSILVMSSSLEENNWGFSEFNLALLPSMSICPFQQIFLLWVGTGYLKGSPPHLCKGRLTKASTEGLPCNKLTGFYFFCLVSKEDRIMIILGQPLIVGNIIGSLVSPCSVKSRTIRLLRGWVQGLAVRE